MAYNSLVELDDDKKNILLDYIYYLSKNNPLYIEDILIKKMFDIEKYAPYFKVYLENYLERYNKSQFIEKNMLFLNNGVPKYKFSYYKDNNNIFINASNSKNKHDSIYLNTSLSIFLNSIEDIEEVYINFPNEEKYLDKKLFDSSKVINGNFIYQKNLLKKSHVLKKIK